MDKDYREKVLWYCRTGHLEEFDDPAKRKSELQKKYVLIAKQKLKKLIEVFGAKELRETMRQEYDAMFMETQHYKYRGQEKWVD